MTRLGLILMMSALVACGCDDDDDDDDVTIDATAGTPDAEAPAADAPPAPVDGAAPDADGEGAFATFTAIQGTGDCMPIVPPDPLGVSFTVLYDNTAGASIAKAIVSEVELTWNDGDGMVATQKVNVAPSVVTIPAGGTMTITHNKTTSIDDLANDCAYCGGTVKVGLSLTINGGDPAVFTSGTGDVECVF